MSQITIYLDDETQRLLRRSAEAAGMPYSRWIAELIRKEARRAWPAEVLASFGAHSNAPLAETIRATDVDELPRSTW